MEKIKKKEIDSVVYELAYFSGDGKYVVYKIEKSLLLKGVTHIPEDRVFDNEEEALVYWNNLDK